MHTHPTVVAGVRPQDSTSLVTEWAATLAAQRGARLHLLAAHPLSPRLAEGVGGLRRTLSRSLHEVATQLRERHPGLDVTHEITWVTPAEALRRASTDADLLVIGRQERSWSGELIQATAPQVMSSAHCPVLVVPEDHQSSPTVPRVVLGWDDDDATPEAARFAFAEAERWGAELQVVLVVEVTPVLTRGGMLTADADQPAHLAGPLGDARAQHPGVSVQTSRIPGRPAEVLTEVAGTDALLVVGTRGRGPMLGTLLGSTSREVLASARGPVAVVAAGDLPAPEVDPDY